MTGTAALRHQLFQHSRYATDRQPLALVFVPDAALRGLVIDLIEDRGFRVHIAAHQVDLVGLAATPQVDAIVSDVSAYGSQLASVGRARIESLARLAPLILVGAGEWAESTSPDDLGVVCIFGSPFDVEEFEEQLQRCLERSQAMLRATPPSEPTPE